MFRYVPLCSGMFRYVPQCSFMFRYVPQCSFMFRYVPVCSGMFLFVSMHDPGVCPLLWRAMFTQQCVTFRCASRFHGSILSCRALLSCFWTLLVKKSCTLFCSLFLSLLKLSNVSESPFLIGRPVEQECKAPTFCFSPCCLFPSFLSSSLPSFLPSFLPSYFNSIYFTLEIKLLYV